MFFPEVNRESALFLFLDIGDTGDVEVQLTETVLGNETSKPVTGQTHRAKQTGSRSDRLTVLFFHRDISCPSNVAQKTLYLLRESTCLSVPLLQLTRLLGIPLLNITLLCVRSRLHLKPFQTSSQLDRTTALCTDVSLLRPFLLETRMVALLQENCEKYVCVSVCNLASTCIYGIETLASSSSS